MVEHEMRDDGNGSRGALRNLFGERRVHVRSGHESRYVVLSPALQAGVAIGSIALVGLLALASYNAIEGRLALVAQQRTLSALAADEAEAEQTAQELEALRLRHAAAESEIARLTGALAQADDGTEAAAELAAREAELAAARAESRELAAALEQARTAAQAEGTARAAELEAVRAEVTGLRAEIGRLEREAASLRGSAAQARQAPRDPQPEAAPPGSEASSDLRIAIATDPAAQEVRRLQQDLAAAQGVVDALSADLEAAKSPRPGGGPSRPSPIVADLATLKAQLSAASQRVEQLGAGIVVAPEAAPDAPADPVPRPSPPAPR
jgi:DNA repair exonuclease SbcCD ATPase subunit